MLTATTRKIEDEHLKFLNRAAYTGGVDFHHYWQNKIYYIDAKGVFSSITGDPQAILALQTASARYFQRPDADHVSIDSSATTLQGAGASIDVGKGGNGNWRWNLSGNFRSPGLDFNDIGYLQQADVAELNGGIAYVQNVPQGIFRTFSIESG